MDLELSDDQELLRRTVRRFLEEPSPSWAGLTSLGLTGILVPEEHGGAGRGMVDMGVVLEEMGRAVHPGPFLSSAVGAVSAVLAAATPSQQAELLPGLAAGTTVGTVALLEPGRRYEWRSPMTRVAGDRVSGTKVFVPEADTADLLLVVAVDDDGLGLFVVDGAEVEPTEAVDGTRRFATVTMDRVPATRLGTGEVGGVVDRLAAAYVADAVGAAERVMELAVEYAKERVQFDRPIGSFQAVQHLCADMLRDVELARAGSWYALWALDAADPNEAHRAVTMAKAFASDALPAVGATAIQVFGGVGFTWEHDAHRFYKRLLTMQHALGGPAEQLEELASLVL